MESVTNYPNIKEHVVLTWKISLGVCSDARKRKLSFALSDRVRMNKRSLVQVTTQGQQWKVTGFIKHSDNVQIWS